MNEDSDKSTDTVGTPPPSPSGTINISTGSITYTLSGNSFNTVVLNFMFGSESVLTTILQPPTLDLQGTAGNDNGTFDYDLTLQPPAGQMFGNLIANKLTVTPKGQEPVVLTSTSLVTWLNTGTILSQYGN